MLPRLTLEESLTHTAHMFLINASSMRGKWEQPFRRADTRRGTFIALNGRKMDADFMNIKADLPYFEDEDAQVQYLEIPYVNREASLCIVLPRVSRKKPNGLLEFEKKLEYDAIIRMSTQKRLRTVQVGLPKFCIENTFDLKELFLRVGMKAAFEDAADFSKMVNEPADFRLHGAFHKTAIGMIRVEQ